MCVYVYAFAPSKNPFEKISLTPTSEWDRSMRARNVAYKVSSTQMVRNLNSGNEQPLLLLVGNKSVSKIVYNFHSHTVAKAGKTMEDKFENVGRKVKWHNE